MFVEVFGEPVQDTLVFLDYGTEDGFRVEDVVDYDVSTILEFFKHRLGIHFRRGNHISLLKGALCLIVPA